jgi:FPC/CPF motif-containing protein YcgG
MTPARPARVMVEGVPVVAGQATAEPWWSETLRLFKESVGHRDYPCHFGRLALTRGELYAAFCDQDTASLADRLSWFLDMSRVHPERRLVLAAFCKSGAIPGSESDYGEMFWRILQGLHDADTEDWPAGIPRDPEDSAWEFSFHGVPMFVFAAAPSYARRASRNVGPGLVLLFQPRNVFDGIEGGTPRGIAARQIIRTRLSQWDTVPPHLDLGDYGDPSNHEWRQYFIPDDQSRLHEKCPLQIRGADSAHPGEEPRDGKEGKDGHDDGH